MFLDDEGEDARYKIQDFGPTVAARFNHENYQQDTLYKLIYYSKSALHVSSDVFAHY